MLDLSKKKINGFNFSEYYKMYLSSYECAKASCSATYDNESLFIKRVGLTDFFEHKNFNTTSMEAVIASFDVKARKEWYYEFHMTLPPSFIMTEVFFGEKPNFTSPSFRDYFSLNLSLNFFFSKSKEQLEFNFD